MPIDFTLSAAEYVSLLAAVIALLAAVVDLVNRLWRKTRP